MNQIILNWITKILSYYTLDVISAVMKQQNDLVSEE